MLTPEQARVSLTMKKKYHVVKQHRERQAPYRLFLYNDDNNPGAEFGLDEIQIFPDGRYFNSNEPDEAYNLPLY